MFVDEEIMAEMAEFLDDTLLREFASDQGLVYEGHFQRVADGYRCTLVLGDQEMRPATGCDEQVALDNATVQAIELLTRGDPALEPELALS